VQRYKATHVSDWFSSSSVYCCCAS